MFPQSPGPIITELGGITLSWYGLFMAAALLCGLFFVRAMARKRDMHVGHVTDGIFYTILFGFLGARIYHVWNEWWYYSLHPSEIWHIWNGGLAIHGGLLFGVITLFLYARYKKIHFLKLLDVVAVGVAIGQVVGRWGNYFNEELFGKPFQGFLALPISPASRPEQYASVETFYPLFLYESVLNLLLFFGLLFFAKKYPLNHGVLIGHYLAWYGLVRFCLDFLRFDQFGFGPLTLAQWVSMVMMIAGTWIIIRSFSKPVDSLSKEL